MLVQFVLSQTKLLAIIIDFIDVNSNILVNAYEALFLRAERSHAYPDYSTEV
jgi:hypothetical protein